MPVAIATRTRMTFDEDSFGDHVIIVPEELHEYQESQKQQQKQQQQHQEQQLLSLLLPKGYRDPEDLNKEDQWLTTNRTIQAVGIDCPRGGALEGLTLTNRDVPSDGWADCLVMDIVFELQYLLSLYAGQGMLMARPILFPTTSLVPFTSTSLSALRTTIREEFGGGVAGGADEEVEGKDSDGAAVAAFFQAMSGLKAKYPVYLYKNEPLRGMALEGIVQVIGGDRPPVGMKLLKCLLALSEYKLRPLRSCQAHLTELMRVQAQGWMILE